MEPQKNDSGASLFRDIDWFTVVLYLAMVTLGVISIYAASYDFDHASIFDGNEFSGKQIRWIGLSLVAALIVLLIDVRFYETYAMVIYVAVIALLILTIFIAPDIKGSRSWIVLGPMSLQPAEFGKTATALALAKLFSTYNFRLNAKPSNYYKALAIIFIPIVLILAQKETGSALAYMALFFVLFREGMSGLVLLGALAAVTIFVVAIKFSETMFLGIPTGEAIVFIMLMVVTVLMLLFYCRQIIAARNVLLGFLAATAVVVVLELCGVPVNGHVFFSLVLGSACIYILFIAFRNKSRAAFVTVGSVLAGVVFLFSVNAAFNTLMEHQQMRVKVALGIEENLRGAGYNVNQSKIAIGSGGVFGKGFLNGTQTKLKYVPEQHTDFIFCTIGEEEGFVGTVAVLLLFVVMILRIITIAERQPSAFARVYAYCVASYLIFHLAINVGMVIGLCPVIGIPLPFFSYGGSSLLGFTLLLFILLRLDASRRDHHSY
ncbi:MAG: rod shape-determining protein RodA [Clostridium sp.]|nr:rod shape-determining protein RodA [Clostridium sp.]